MRRSFLAVAALLLGALLLLGLSLARPSSSASSKPQSASRGGEEAEALERISQRGCQRAAGGVRDGSSGHVSYLLARLGYVQENMHSPPLLRQPRCSSVLVDVGMYDGTDYTKPALLAGHRVFAFEMGRGKVDDLEKWAVQEGISYDRLAPESPGTKLASMPDRRPAAARPRLYLINAALSSNTSVMSYLKADASAADTLEIEAKFRPCASATCETETVGVLRLDDIVDEDIWLLKVDTQGYDCHVLMGAERLLRRRRVEYITLEFAPDVMDTTGCGARELLQYLHDLEYQCFDWMPLSDDFDNRIASQTFDDYLRDFDPAHSAVWVGSKWTELFCVHRSLL